MVLHEEDGAPVGCIYDIRGQRCKQRSDIHFHSAVALCSEVSPTGRCSRCDAMRQVRLSRGPRPATPDLAAVPGEWSRQWSKHAS
ncbi:MAG TPA: hypothetical protein VMB72_02410 [Acidimicrobiales bacterium]|nr:hypothetical protein [Acidimicrobiales bacterium]